MADRDRAPDPTLGVFDTLLVRDGRPVDLTVHLERLTRSVAELYGVRVAVAGLAERLLAEVEGMATARVRTTYDPVRTAMEIDATAIAEPGLEPRSLEVRRLPGGLGPHKWLDRPHAPDWLAVDLDGAVLEAAWANVWIEAADGALLTPPADGRILPGVTRARLLADPRAREARLTLTDLRTARAILLTSSIRLVTPAGLLREPTRWARILAARLREDPAISTKTQSYIR